MQQRAEHDERQRDGQHGERARPAAAPQARAALAKRVFDRPHATSTILPLIERDRPSSDQANELAIVRRDEHGRPAGVDLAQQVHDLEREIRIEVAGRFVGDAPAPDR